MHHRIWSYRHARASGVEPPEGVFMALISQEQAELLSVTSVRHSYAVAIQMFQRADIKKNCTQHIVEDVIIPCSNSSKMCLCNQNVYKPDTLECPACSCQTTVLWTSATQHRRVTFWRLQQIYAKSWYVIVEHDLT